VSERTALEIADSLEVEMLSLKNADDAAEMLRSQAAEIDRLKRERQHVYDLLARIHRDGGQYTAKHGIVKSCDDAEAQVVTWLKTISEVDSLIKQARIAEREACAAVCENGSFLHDAAPTAIFGKECARAIRARSAT